MSSKARTKARITVVVRKRPLTPAETNKNETDIISMLDGKTSIRVGEPRKNVFGLPYIEPHDFTFDRAYSDLNTNTEVYKSCVKKLVDAVFQQGARCSCFAYGQTGSGKTYTMIGQGKLGSVAKSSDDLGLIMLAGKDIFMWLNRPEYSQIASLYVSFFEIYCNRIYDLLNSRNIVKALETKSMDRVHFKNLTCSHCTGFEALAQYLMTGLEQRVVGANSKNLDSSRGHAILTLDIRHNVTNQTLGKLAFIDLAGSERGADAMHAGKLTQMDGAGINRSLLALKECIRALDQQSTHVPFRDSELTKVLRDMFIGNKTKTLMISCVSPTPTCCEQTLNTLRYADRVKAIRRYCQPDLDESTLSGHEDKSQGSSRSEQLVDSSDNESSASLSSRDGGFVKNAPASKEFPTTIQSKIRLKLTQLQRLESESSESQFHHTEAAPVIEVSRNKTERLFRVDDMSKGEKLAFRTGAAGGGRNSSHSNEIRGKLPVTLKPASNEKKIQHNIRLNGSVISTPQEVVKTSITAAMSQRKTLLSGKDLADSAASLSVSCFQPDSGVSNRDVAANYSLGSSLNFGKAAAKKTVSLAVGSLKPKLQGRLSADETQKLKGTLAVEKPVGSRFSTLGALRMDKLLSPRNPTNKLSRLSTLKDISGYKTERAVPLSQKLQCIRENSLNDSTLLQDSQYDQYNLPESLRKIFLATRSEQAKSRLAIDRIFPRKQVDQLTAAATIVQKRFQQLSLPPTLQLLYKHETITLSTATEILKTLSSLPPQEIFDFYTQLTAKLDALYQEMTRFHHECIEGQTYLNLSQHQLLDDLDDKNMFKIDFKYLTVLRQIIDNEIVMYSRLGKRLAEIERMQALLAQVFNSYHEAKRLSQAQVSSLSKANCQHHPDDDGQAYLDSGSTSMC